jgi:hypothetical protein
MPDIYEWQPSYSPNPKFIFGPCKKCIVLPACKRSCGKLRHIEIIFHETWTKTGTLLLFGVPICLILLGR